MAWYIDGNGHLFWDANPANKTPWPTCPKCGKEACVAVTGKKEQRIQSHKEHGIELTVVKDKPTKEVKSQKKQKKQKSKG